MRKWLALITLLALSLGAAWGEIDNGNRKTGSGAGAACCCCCDGGSGAAACSR